MEKLQKAADILNVNLRSIKEYMNVWGELYDMSKTSPLELAEMIKDIISYYE